MSGEAAGNPIHRQRRDRHPALQRFFMRGHSFCFHRSIWSSSRSKLHLRRTGRFPKHKTGLILTLQTLAIISLKLFKKSLKCQAG